MMEVGSKFRLDPERRRSCSPYPEPLCRVSAASAGACVLPTARASAYSDGRGHSRHRTPHDHQSAPRRRPGLAPGHPSSYHRVFSRRRWCVVALGHGPGRNLILRHLGPRRLRRAGRRRHRRRASRRPASTARAATGTLVARPTATPPIARAASRSSLAILVPLPVRQPSLGPSPCWSLLYRSRESNQQHRRRHRTPAAVAPAILVAVALHWFPAPPFHADR